MERKVYELTEKQIKKAQDCQSEMPSDDEIKAIWKKQHHGKVTGWGMKKAEIDPPAVERRHRVSAGHLAGTG